MNEDKKKAIDMLFFNNDMANKTEVSKVATSKVEKLNTKGLISIHNECSIFNNIFTKTALKSYLYEKNNITYKNDMPKEIRNWHIDNSNISDIINDYAGVYYNDDDIEKVFEKNKMYIDAFNFLQNEIIFKMICEIEESICEKSKQNAEPDFMDISHNNYEDRMSELANA